MSSNIAFTFLRDFSAVLRGLVFGVFFLFSVAHAAEPDGKRGFGSRPNIRETLQDLNLTKEQKEEMFSMRENRTKMRSLVETMQSNRRALIEDLKDPKISDDALRAQGEKLRDLATKVMEQRLENALRLRSILTPQQFQEFLDKMVARSDQGED